MLRKVLNKFRGLKDIVRFIKGASTVAIMRLFNSRRAKYDDLLNRMNSFIDVVHASGGVTEIDVTGDLGGSRGRGKGSKLGTERFQDGVAVPIDFVAPDRKKLAKDVQMFDEAEQYIVELEEMVKRLEKKKDKASAKMVKEMNSYMNQLIKTQNEILDVIDELASEHTPEPMQKLTADLVKHVNDILPEDAYSGMHGEMYVSSHKSLTGGKNEPIEFSYFLYIDELHKDSFTSKQLIVVLTGIVHEVRKRPKAPALYTEFEVPDEEALRHAERQAGKEGHKARKEYINELAAEIDKQKPKTKKRVKPSFYLTFHVTALPEFQAPGMFKEGRQLTGKSVSGLAASMKREVSKLVSLYSLMPQIGRRKINVTHQKILHSGIMDVDGILDVAIENDQIVIELTGMANDVIKDEVWPEIIVYLRKALRAPRKTSFTYELEKDGRTKIMRVSHINNVVDN